MKKKLSEVFDEAKANELEMLVDNNEPAKVPAATLSAVKQKVYEKTGLKKAQRRPLVFRWQPLVAAAACLVLVIGLLSGLPAGAVDATFTVDVNPSIRVSLDKNERIVAVEALNPEAQRVLDGLKPEGKELEDGLEEVVQALVANGFVTELSNSVLVSIDGDDEKSVALRDKLAHMIKKLLDDGQVEGAVLSQTNPEDADLRALAREFDISMGKAAIISKIVRLDGRYVFEELVHISIHELNLILEKCGDEELEVNRQGQASKKAYISAQQALEAALADLGITAQEISDVEIELEYYHEHLVYEVELHYGGNEFEYAVNALDGAVLKVEVEREDDDDDDDVIADPAKNITAEQALEAALADAQVQRTQIYDVSVELEDDDGRLYYEVEFETADTEYEYDIAATDGSILEREIDPKDIDDDDDDDD